MEENHNISIKHVTLNVRGLRRNEKRQNIYHWIKSNNINIAFLQETYFTTDIEEKVNFDWKGYSKHCFSDSVHSRGVSILFDECAKVTIENSYTSIDGRKLLINVVFNDQLITVVNLYAPNKCNDRVAFLKKASKWIKSHMGNEHFLIIAGDMNCNQKCVKSYKAFCN